MPRRWGAAVRSGFTLVEGLVAMALIAITFVSLYAGIASCLFTIRFSRENLRASQILVEKMEAIRTYSWDQINSNGFIPANFVVPYYSDGSSNGGGLFYTGSVAITSVPFTANYSNQMKEIKVTLTWATQRMLRTRDVNSYVARYGLQRYVFKDEE